MMPYRQELLSPSIAEAFRYNNTGFPDLCGAGIANSFLFVGAEC